MSPSPIPGMCSPKCSRHTICWLEWCDTPLRSYTPDQTSHFSVGGSILLQFFPLFLNVSEMACDSPTANNTPDAYPLPHITRHLPAMLWYSDLLRSNPPGPLQRAKCCLWDSAREIFAKALLNSWTCLLLVCVCVCYTEWVGRRKQPVWLLCCKWFKAGQNWKGNSSERRIAVSLMTHKQVWGCLKGLVVCWQLTTWQEANMMVDF